MPSRRAARLRTLPACSIARWTMDALVVGQRAVEVEAFGRKGDLGLSAAPDWAVRRRRGRSPTSIRGPNAMVGGVLDDVLELAHFTEATEWESRELLPRGRARRAGSTGRVREALIGAA